MRAICHHAVAAQRTPTSKNGEAGHNPPDIKAKIEGMGKADQPRSSS